MLGREDWRERRNREKKKREKGGKVKKTGKAGRRRYRPKIRYVDQEGWHDESYFE
jgi:hypothetical protein